MDEVERSKEDQDRFDREALERQLARMPTGESAEECEDCGDPIPEERRQAYRGCTRCVKCQARAERRMKEQG